MSGVFKKKKKIHPGADLFHRSRLQFSSVFNCNSYSENNLHKETIHNHYFTFLYHWVLKIQLLWFLKHKLSHKYS